MVLRGQKTVTTDHFNNPLLEGTYFHDLNHLTTVDLVSPTNTYIPTEIYPHPLTIAQYSHSQLSAPEPVARSLPPAGNLQTKKQAPQLLTPPYSSTDATKPGSRVMKQESPTAPTSSRTITPGSMKEESPAEATAAAPTAAAAAPKPKRVRTGCLTCRERHLKCDEGLPKCQNCKKSSRECKRGVKLNFIDIDCRRPQYILPPTHDWKVVFQDDSREIASEYRGGLERYAPLERSPKRRRLTSTEVTYDYSVVPGPIMGHQQMQQQATYQTYAESTSPLYTSTMANTGQQPFEDPMATMGHPMTIYADQSRQSYDQSMLLTPVSSEQQQQHPPYITDQQELLYMQVYIEEVGIWMDSMDAEKHFSRLLPFQALRQPMLKHALLACGVRHLTLVNPATSAEHAVSYYNMASQALLKQLSNPDRDQVLCATTAVVLNVYEVMSEKALQRMNHIAGARALVKDCGWDARSTGIAGACFWLNVGLEMFSCLHFNWKVAWDPETWGIDMTMNAAQTIRGDEDDWTHKILWILAKITNFRASKPKFQEQSAHAEQMRMHHRHQEWLVLKQYCDKWESCIPLAMHPMGCTNSHESTFPKVWYVDRTSVVAALFYHTALALLGSVHPYAEGNPQVAEDMQTLRVYSSKQICGIVAHVKDRGVASASIRCLAIAGEHLTDRREQEEVLNTFEQIKKETGWRVNFINDVLREKWGWNTPNPSLNSNGSGPSSFYQHGNPTMPAPNPSRPSYQSGIINPLYKNADFAAPNPPYQGSYVPPNINLTQAAHNSAQLYAFPGISAM